MSAEATIYPTRGVPGREFEVIDISRTSQMLSSRMAEAEVRMYVCTSTAKRCTSHVLHSEQDKRISSLSIAFAKDRLSLLTAYNQLPLSHFLMYSHIRL